MKTFAETIQDPEDKAKYEVVLAEHNLFHARRPDSPCFSGPFLRALEEHGLEDVKQQLLKKYYMIVLNDW